MTNEELLGPIPARAGEPQPPNPSLPFPGAYPRSRGGTFGNYTDADLIRGLSPLARGNLVESVKFGADRGPIPARAGEPAISRSSASWSRAYPRSRGGTEAEVRRCTG